MSVADISADNPNGDKKFLADRVSIFFINDKTGVINGPKKLRNTPSGLVIFLVVSYYKILLFS